MLQTHRDKHLFKKKLTSCPECDYKGTETQDKQKLIVRHFDTVHNKLKKYACEYSSCDYKTAEKRSLNSHLYRKHSETGLLERCFDTTPNEFLDFEKVEKNSENIQEILGNFSKKMPDIKLKISKIFENSFLKLH